MQGRTLDQPARERRRERRCAAARARARDVGERRRIAGASTRPTWTRGAPRWRRGCSSSRRSGPGGARARARVRPGRRRARGCRARRVPGGHVVLSDVVPGDGGDRRGARADALGLANVSTRVLDLEEIDEPDASYDAVLCPRGTDVRGGSGPRRARDRAGAPAGRALRGRGVGAARPQPVARSRLRRGQRAARASRCPRPASRARSRSRTPTASPRSCARARSRGSSVEELADAGPRRVVRRSGGRGREASRARSRRCSQQLPARRSQALEQRLREAVAPYESPGGLEIPGVTLLARATR